MQGFRHFPSSGDHLSLVKRPKVAPVSFKLVHAAVAKRQQVDGGGACVLYTNPTSATTLPVLEDVTLTWNPCINMDTSTVDLYLSVQTDSGLKPVHLWQHVPYSNASLTTQLNPSWWNASSGAGQVSAQVSPWARYIPVECTDLKLADIPRIDASNPALP
jgi:hypothetical protein